MSSALEKWHLGTTKTLFESDALNLKVTITKRKNEKFKKFHSFVDLFVLNIEKIDSTKKNIGLTFEKINLLESIVKSFYNKTDTVDTVGPNTFVITSKLCPNYDIITFYLNIFI